MKNNNYSLINANIEKIEANSLNSLLVGLVAGSLITYLLVSE